MELSPYSHSLGAYYSPQIDDPAVITVTGVEPDTHQCTFGEWTANDDGLTHSRVCTDPTCGRAETQLHTLADGACDLCGYRETVYEPGDVNGDGSITYRDAQAALEFAVGIHTPEPWQEALGDVDGNPGLDYRDALAILQYSVGNIPALPVK